MNRPIASAAADNSPESVAATRLFWLFAGGHLLLWTAVAIFTQPNPPLDMVEMIYWGQHWQWGYYKHPPLPAWIGAATFGLTGSVGLIYLVSQLLVVTNFWAVWRLGREIASPWTALAAAVVLEACYYYNVTTLDLNNTIVCRTFWSLTVLFLYWGLARGQLQYWAAAGIAMALGMLSKYYLALLVLSFLALPLVDLRARRALKTAGPYVATAVALLLFAPHVWWMHAHDWVTVAYFFERSDSAARLVNHVLQPLSFLLRQAGAYGPLLLLLLPVIGRNWRFRPLAAEERFARNFLSVAVLGPIGLCLLISLGSGAHLRSMWGGPLWTFFPLWLLFCFQAEPQRQGVQQAFRLAAVAGVLLAAVMAGRNLAGPYLREEPSRVHFPGRELARAVQQRWREHTGEADAPPLVGGTWWQAANVSLYLPNRPLVYAELNPDYSPWTSDAQLREQGGVILYALNYETLQPLTPGWEQRFPRAVKLKPIALRWQTAAAISPARIGIAVVPPSPPPVRQAQRSPEVDKTSQ